MPTSAVISKIAEERSLRVGRGKGGRSMREDKTRFVTSEERLGINFVAMILRRFQVGDSTVCESGARGSKIPRPARRRPAKKKKRRTASRERFACRMRRPRFALVAVFAVFSAAVFAQVPLDE